ncbi:MAG: hypothetical protein Q8J78_13335 [Moraxellaceae bacterium]|nr:hypothetical protein [Moraxellaceae bacterium]
MSTFAVRAANAADNAGLLRLLGVPQPSKGVQLAFERAPDYFHSAGVMHEDLDVLVAERESDGAIVGMGSMGWRDLYVNGERQRVRYAADLRVAEECQGTRLILYMNRGVRERIGDVGWYQSVILEENERSRQTLEGSRAGLPVYRPHVGIETWTMTGRRHRATGTSALATRTATAADIPAMNAFVQSLAAHYQFLPAYDFSALALSTVAASEQASANPYYKGLTLDDFLLVSDANGLRGLVGLWNQKAFKQTRIVGYHPLLAFARPLYNVWARLFGGLILPPQGGVLDYQVLHSPLTRPDDREAFDALLDAAWDSPRRRDGAALVLTLSDPDPRCAAMARFRALSLRGRHYLVAFNEAAHPVLEPERIPYFECGRL